MRNSGPEPSERPDLRPAFADDEVYIRLHRGAQKGDATNLGRCPSRAASKTSMPTLTGQRNFPSL